jgi:transcriptional pleiotropic repressor
MSVYLLDKIRRINKLLHTNSSSKVVFNDICSIVTSCLDSNVLVISHKGKVLGAGISNSFLPITDLLTSTVGEFIDEFLNRRLSNILSTQDNVNLITLGFDPAAYKDYTAIISPIEISGERLGTIFIYTFKAGYTIDDIILSEYATTVVGLEILRSETEETEEELRKKHLVQSAFHILSASETNAIKAIVKELDSMEGVIIASRVADKTGITRSVIVNTLRKFESAGIIESRSGGMKGTHIKIKNEYLLTAIKELEAQETT